ncbi:MAG: carbamoyltransferase [Candidatus Omnitrophota bacterium]|nr:carbamoyltransferase [Candidatus Omnitrophota bacterium]
MSETGQYILGISAFYHDSAACLLKDGDIVAAAQEERFTRKKHDAVFPRQAIAYCLREAGITMAQVRYVAFYEKPFIKFERLLMTYLNYAPWGLSSFLKAMPVWLKEKIFIKELIKDELQFTGEIIFPEHHESHAASAFFPSPFQKAAVITLDGVGEWTTTSWGTGEGNAVELKSELHFPHSLGLLYSAFTYYVGFRVNSGEYKLMGLAPYGRPEYADLIRKELVDIKPDGSFRLNMKYFNYPVGLTMTNARFHKLFGGGPRKPETKITQKHMDIAASIQKVTEEIMVNIANHVHRQTGLDNLCLAGGVALNCVGNGKILKQTPFKNVWIQPAAGDAGGALGAALIVWHRYLDKPRRADGVNDSQKGSLLGPDVDGDIRALADAQGWVYEYLSDDALPARVAGLIAEEKVIGLCRGRMEFGPRALGSRSIVADARSEKMQSLLNLKVKFRESFRPFAPAVLKEKCAEYFDLGGESPYMLLVADVQEGKRLDARSSAEGIELLKVKRSVIPAVTHVDYSARVQTVDEERNPLFYRLIKAFEKRTGSPVVINTSFNIRGEPIVCSARDAYRCFMCTDMDYLLVGNHLFEREHQPNKDAYKKEDISTVLD